MAAAADFAGHSLRWQCGRGGGGRGIAAVARVSVVRDFRAGGDAGVGLAKMLFIVINRE